MDEKELERQVANMPLPIEIKSTCPECGEYTLVSGAKYDSCSVCGYYVNYP